MFSLYIQYIHDDEWRNPNTNWYSHMLASSGKIVKLQVWSRHAVNCETEDLGLFHEFSLASLGISRCRAPSFCFLFFFSQVASEESQSHWQQMLVMFKSKQLARWHPEEDLKGYLFARNILKYLETNNVHSIYIHYAESDRCGGTGCAVDFRLKIQMSFLPFNMQCMSVCLRKKYH